MRKILIMVLLQVTVLSAIAYAGDFPVLIYHPPKESSSSQDLISHYDSLLVWVGITHFIGWASPTAVSVADDFGLKIVTVDKANIDTSGAGKPVWDNVKKLIESGTYAPMDIPRTADEAVMGYYFEYDDNIGAVFTEPGSPDFDVFRCRVSEHSSGYLFSHGPHWEDNNMHSVFGQVNGAKDTFDLNWAARFRMKIPSGAQDSVSVCRIDAFKRGWDNDNRVIGDTVRITDSVIMVEDFSVKGEYTSIDFSFTAPTGGYYALALHWYDSVDVYVDEVTVFNNSGDFYWNADTTDVETAISAYFNSVGDYSNIVGYHVADEAGGSSYPLMKLTNDVLQEVTSGEVPVYANLIAASAVKMNPDVLCNFVGVDVVPFDRYLPTAMVNRDSDLYYDPPTDSLYQNWECRIQEVLDILFYGDIDVARQRAHFNDRELWWIMRSQGGGWVRSKELFCIESDDTVSYYRWYKNGDMLENDFKVQIYMALAHDVDGIGFWRGNTSYFENQPCYAIQLDEGEPAHSPMYYPYHDYEGDDELDDCDPWGWHSRCYCGGCGDSSLYWTKNSSTYPDPTADRRVYGGLFDYDCNDTCYHDWCLTEEAVWVHDILQRAKPMGELLADCEFDTVGLVDSAMKYTSSIGFIDSVVGQYRVPGTDTLDWIEVATFTHNETGDKYFMLVNRRLLESETNIVDVYLNASSLCGDISYFVIDVTTEDTTVINSEGDYAFQDTLQPGEGYLYELVPMGAFGSMLGEFYGVTIAGDITVEEGDTLRMSGGTYTVAASDWLLAGVDTSMVEIIVKGTLQLDYNATLRSINDTPGSWYGIRVVDNGRLETLCYAANAYKYVEDTYIGISFEDTTTSGYFEVGCEYYAGFDADSQIHVLNQLIIRDCEVGGLYINTDSITFFDVFDLVSDTLQGENDFHDSLVIKDVLSGWGIKVESRCPDFNWLVSVENCETGLYAGSTDDDIYSLWIYNDSVDNAYGVYHLGTSLQDTLRLRHVLIHGNYNSMISATGRSWLYIDECILAGDDPQSVPTGISALGPGRVVMRHTDLYGAHCAIYAANPASNFGVETDSGWNNISIDLEDTTSLYVNYMGMGTLNTLGNYWGDGEVDTTRFEYGMKGYVAWNPHLTEEADNLWVCDSLPSMGSCYMTQGGNPSKIAMPQEPEQLPHEFSLSQNYPNPFNPATKIEFSLKHAGHVRIDIYNLLGQRVKTLVDVVKQEGPHSVIWDGTDKSGEEVASGIYFYKMETDSFVKTQKMLLLK